MTGVPRTSVEDAFTSGLRCAICSQSDLYVQHLPAYPDFVTCRACGAAFVVEDTGERVMYGKIPDGYPDTSEFALRQWVWLEAVERQAAGGGAGPRAPASDGRIARSIIAVEPGRRTRSRNRAGFRTRSAGRRRRPFIGLARRAA